MELTLDLKVRMAAALNQVLPDPAAATATPDGLRVIIDDRRGPALRVVGGVQVLGWDWNEDVDVETLALRVLEDSQDAFVESVARGPWPPVDPDQPEASQAGQPFPEPHAEIRGNELRRSYGDPEHPSLAIPTVPLRSG